MVMTLLLIFAVLKCYWPILCSYRVSLLSDAKWLLPPTFIGVSQTPSKIGLIMATEEFERKRFYAGEFFFFWGGGAKDNFDVCNCLKKCFTISLFCCFVVEKFREGKHVLGWGKSGLGAPFLPCPVNAFCIFLFDVISVYQNFRTDFLNQVWNTSSCEFVRTLQGHRRGIACLQYRDRLVVSGSSDFTIR